MIDLSNKTSYEAKPNAIPSLALRIEEVIHNVHLNIDTVQETFISDILPFEMLKANIIWHLCDANRSSFNHK